MAFMDDFSLDDETNKRSMSPIRRLTGPAAAPDTAGGPIARAASLAAEAPAADSPASTQTEPTTPRIAQLAEKSAIDSPASGSDARSPIASLITARTSSGPTNVPIDVPAIAAPAANGIIGGGDTVYAPGQAARTDPYMTADGRSINPNDANLSTDDRSAIGQYKAQNAQMLADMERQQRTNPLAGAVQIIRPGNEVSHAIQGPDRMIEIDAPAYGAFQSAFARNPGMAGRAQMSERGMLIDGQLAPPNVVGYGDDALKAYHANARKDAETGLDAGTLAKIAEEDAKSRGALAVAKANAQGHIDAARVTNGAGETDAPATAPILGVPVPTVTPWGGQTNSRDANKVKAAEIARGGKEVEKDSDNARAMADTAQAAKQFLELNQKNSTGGMVDKTAAGRWVKGFNPDYATMESITSKLTPQARPPGSGSSSDSDMRLFGRATIGVDKPQKTNENIAKGIIASADQQKEYANFRQTYLEQNRTLQGADRYWKEYADKNPIFDPSKEKEGTFDLNPARQSWREHFAAKSDAPPPTRSVQFNGANAEARLASDGKYYVKTPSGKYAEVRE